ncbi:MAG TPA: PEP/pyruvate-binding domain-containing protein [Steroidobacteraceae bacterium]|nr:PEP/pyruvate-binding domain-containing protein [Steroidobacteraceae bacterium]
MTDSLLVASSDPRCLRESEVGGKAASLATLTAAGFDVPAFCVVSCEAFLTHRAGGADPLRRPLRQWLDTQPPASRFAVRSSARGEDSADNSFAGLYSTILGVTGIESLLEAVQRCWLSYENPEARNYRERRANDAGAMGVVIQALVPAEWSGVAFAVNPVTLALSEGMISAVPGLGEALVSGSVNPEEILVSAPSGEVRSRKAAADTPPLPGTILRKVWEMTLAAGTHFRFPQDIEWAAVGERVFMLQSRPITTVADVFYSRNIEPWRASERARPDDPDRLWTRAYADEIWAPPVSPLFYNIQNLTPSFAAYWRWHGDPGPLPPDVFKYYKATAYADVAVVRRQYDYHPPFSRIAGILNFFPADMQDAVRRDKWLWRGRLRRTLLFELQQRHVRSLAHNHETLASLWPGFIRQSDEWFDLDLDSMTLEQIAAHRAELDKVVGVVSPACGFAVAYHAHDLTFILTGLLDSWFGSGDELYALVTSGLEGSITVEESEQIWRLAQQLRSSNADFAVDFERFWHSHRHRGASYKDLIYPRWGDDREQLLELVRSYLDSRGVSPREQNLRMSRTRRETQARLLAECTGLTAWRRPLLRWLFRYNEIYMSERDNHRFYFDRVWYQLRRIYRSYGRRLAASGVLGTGDDVFYLGAPEVEQALRGELDGREAQARVQVRRRVWHETLRIQSPKFLLGYTEYADRARRTDITAAIGIGASPGLVTGTARIIYDARELPKVRDGEILITRQTDPAWSTVFARIAGLVLETGGVLAHGASLCREFNLPCVTALDRATELFHDGDTITVDGTHGRVQLMSGGMS